MDVFFDCETRSLKDLTKVGVLNYLTTQASDLICIGYRCGMDSATSIWVPNVHDEVPDVFKNPEDHRFYAFNITFDKLAIDYLGPKYGLGSIPIENCIDVMALTSRYGLPASLEKAGDALKIPFGKSSKGKRLLTKITMPPWEYTMDEFKWFLHYCVTDVDLMCEIIKALPSNHLNKEEQINWQQSFKVNSTGVPIDILTIRRIHTVISRYTDNVAKRVPLITDGAINTIGQRDAIITWAADRGVMLPDYTKETVDSVLEDPDLPPDVRSLLEIKQLIGMPSTKKYGRMLLRNYKGRVFHNFRYYGGHTGRETSMVLQLHNLPRGTLKTKEDIEQEIKKFHDMSILDGNPVLSAKSLIRPMIKATSHNMLGVHDYSSIEHILLVWLAKEEEALKFLRNGGDNYVRFASRFYQLEEEDITSEQRRFGKTAILGCGYMMGGPRLYETCNNFSISTSLEECYAAVKLFRATFPRINNLWYSLKDCAVNALYDPGNLHSTNGCTFSHIADRNRTPWLALRLPSGRTLYYREPLRNSEMEYGPIFTYMGIHPKTKKYTRLEAGPNKIIENIIQALGRDILMDGRSKIMKEYSLIASVHDENITEVPEDNYKAHWLRIQQLMETAPDWCNDMPLRVTGYCEKRYRKD